MEAQSYTSQDANKGPAWGLIVFVVVALLTALIIGVTVHENEAVAAAASTTAPSPT